MLALFISWWYGAEFVIVLQYFRAFLAYLYDLFSVRICLRTLFAVWRRDQISYKELSLPEILEAMTLNTASRLVGFVIKTLTLISYLIATVLSLAIFFLLALVWLLIPAIIAIFIYLGFKNVLRI